MIINYSDQTIIKNKKSIFLAGPTPRDEKTKSWRTTACERLNELGFDGVVYVPDNAAKIKYLDWLYQMDYNNVPINNLEELLKVSMILADKLYDEKNTEILPLSKRKILERK